MEELFDEEEEETIRRFNYQKKCQGLCGGKTFTAGNGNEKYYEKCRKKLKIPAWKPKEK